MTEENTFRPPRRRGLIFQIGAALAFFSAGGLTFWLAMDQEIGLYFIGLLFISMVFLAPVPLIVYRAIALGRATYELEREGLRLRWGLRAEDIPLNTIEWVRPASELGFHLNQPRFSWPGALLGFSSVAELGLVEFIAAEPDTLLLIATPTRIFAISPAQPKVFMKAFQRTSEMGSLSPMPAFSSQPAAFMRNVWRDRIARLPILVSLIATILLLAGTVIIIPSRNQISIGFTPTGSPLPPVSPERLLLLPILAAISVAISLSVGLFYYRHLEQRMAAYLILAGAGTTPVLLLISLLFLR
ncbi:PH domain-containing protein [Leptolinea tardivitalis]|uniref:Bacterial Pleckstrin homology domain-containing protein n=1 Tax=Leptolinea tardivitalis TaxID=229920 RepID=A0A0P6X9F5_9CHLR|nr:PH domain-containing protein [Leptolinea tardivitalis]KPL71040.1 hypothetical protein ADM99_12190 [Leptolinea tardivitalis]GAP22450.1 protein containing bacterial PH domain [Leptolinea tardivitalis]